MGRLTFHKVTGDQAKKVGVKPGTIVQVELFSNEEMAKNHRQGKGRDRISQFYPNVTKEDDGTVYPWSPIWED